MRETAKAYADQCALLSRVKGQQGSGAMQPKLYQVLDDTTNGRPPDLRLVWLFYAGMGEIGVSEMKNPDEKQAAAELIEKGKLVPTMREYEGGTGKILRLTHFDDVHWGKTRQGDLLIYELSDNPNIPDTIIRPGERHDAAIALLKERIKWGMAQEDDPVLLSNKRDKITPILTDEHVIQMRKRQKGLTP